jgi:predicted nucleic acid-binding protein
MSLVVDASVALRWFIEAPGSPEASALLEGDDPLIAPDLVVPEVTNAAWKLARAGEITREHAERIAAAAPSSFTALLGAAGLAVRALSLALELGHPVYDCLYLALAEAEKTRVVTADERLLRRVRGTPWRKLVKPLG